MQACASHVTASRARLRARRVWWLSGLLLAAAMFAGCTTDLERSEQPSLQEVVRSQHSYDGSIITLEGTVRTYPQPLHYWIEDGAQHRVEVFPHTAVEQLVGAHVRVTGRFTFDPDRGRGIEVTDLVVLREPPQAAGEMPYTADVSEARENVPSRT